MMVRIICTILIFFYWYHFAGAITVDRTVLFDRQPGNFINNVKSAFNSKTNKTLVTWLRHSVENPNPSIWGRLLHENGTPNGAAFQIVIGSNSYFPDVVYNPDANQFVLVYSKRNSSVRFEVFAQKLNFNGRRIGQPVRVSLQSDIQKNVNNYLPRIIYSTSTKGYFVLWTRGGVGEHIEVGEGLHGMVMNSDLTIRKSPTLMSTLQRQGTAVKGPYVSDIGYHEPSKSLLIAGYSISNEPGFSVQYFLSKADVTLEKSNIVLTKLKNDLSSGAAPHVDLMFLQSGQAAALFVEGTGLKRRKISSLGAPIGPVTFFLNEPARTIPVEYPATAFSSADGRSEVITITLDDSISQSGRLFLQASNGSGIPSGQSIEIQSGFDGTMPHVISALPLPSENGFWYAIVYIEGVQLTQPPSRSESSGVFLLRVNTAP